MIDGTDRRAGLRTHITLQRRVVAYVLDRDKNVWVSKNKGAYGEPLTSPMEGTDDLRNKATLYGHSVVRLADPPMQCAVCHKDLPPGADIWHTFDDNGDMLGIICHECGGQPYDTDGDIPDFADLDRRSCSFCRKRGDQVRKLIAGCRGSYICNECVTVCNKLLDDPDDGQELS